jgi:DNA invertase Pin-like site-specific DNA recombinase
MTKKNDDPDRISRRSRVAESLALNKTTLAEDEERVERSRSARRDLILLALKDAENGDNLFSYDEVAEMTGLTRSAVYKIVRNGFKDAPLSEQRAEATETPVPAG